MYNAEVLLDSLNPNGTRLTTLRITLPRFLLAELNTHRRFSESAGSSRAISVERRIRMVEESPFVPEIFGKNQRGMQAGEVLDDALANKARTEWLLAARKAIESARGLAHLGVHKQLANRILEPFAWVSVIVSSTEWDNFFTLRISPLAQPELRKIAEMMKDALDNSRPNSVPWSFWHIPLADDKYVAAGRIARVSYEVDPKSDEEEIALTHRLMTDKHWSPFEHIATACHWASDDQYRNYGPGWVQWRAMLDGSV